MTQKSNILMYSHNNFKLTCNWMIISTRSVSLKKDIKPHQLIDQLGLLHAMFLQCLLQSWSVHTQLA